MIFLSDYQELREEVFYNCIKLEEVVLPNSLECIPQEMFYGCVALQNIAFGENIKEIAYDTEDMFLELKRGKTEELHGTSASFIPNKKYFHSVKIPRDFILSRCKIASALGFRARCIIDGEEQDTNCTIFDLIKEENDKVSTYVNVQPIEVIASTAEKMKVALRYTSETNDRYFGYTNLLSNYLGGTHVQELSKTIIAAWKEFIEAHKNLKPAIELHNNDFLIFVTHQINLTEVGALCYSVLPEVATLVYSLANSLNFKGFIDLLTPAGVWCPWGGSNSRPIA